MFTVTVPATIEHEAKAAAFARSLAPDVKQTYNLAGTIKFEVPCASVELSDVFARVEQAKQEGLHLIDWGIHNASLEDVFISLASKA